MTSPRLCLNMIVKNEAARILRCLESVLPHVTSFAVADTGSTDETPRLIANFFAERKIPGVIASVPFEDFSQARNAALRLAETLEKGSFDYVLLSDADMQLEVDGDAFPALADPVYEVAQHGGSLVYDNVRLIRADVLHACEYREPTHEYLSSPVPASPRLAGVHFVDHADGSNRVDKFERDVRLLKGALEKSPGNARAYFYLAETYRFMGRYSDAIGLYDLRRALGGWAEEVWYAAYQAARCTLDLAKSAPDLGLEAIGIQRALEAYDLRPHRSEPLYLLAHHFRNTSRERLAAVFARELVGRPLPSDKLFVEHDAHVDGPKNEFSIAGFYSPIERVREEARDVTFALALDRDAEPWARDLARSNSQHYAKRLGEICPSATLMQIPTDSLKPCDGWAAMNPSVFAMRGELYANIRRVNYTVGPTGHYFVKGRPFGHGDQILTRNEIVRLGPDGPVSLGFLQDKAGGDRTDFYVQGYEDLRLFVHNERLWATATVRDRHPSGDCEIALLRIALRDDLVIERANVVKVPGGAGRHEKNWAPFAETEEERPMTMLYTTAPLRMLEIEPQDSAVLSDETYDVTPLALDHLRGSSQVVPWGAAGFLYVAHEAIERPGAERRYLHRFVELDSVGQIAAVSEPFWFQHAGIEFCAGLAARTANGVDKLVLSYGVRDFTAHLATVDADEVRLLLSRS